MKYGLNISRVEFEVVDGKSWSPERDLLEAKLSVDYSRHWPEDAVEFVEAHSEKELDEAVRRFVESETGIPVYKVFYRIASVHAK